MCVTYISVSTHHLQNRLQPFAQRRPNRLQCKRRLVALQYLDQLEEIPASRSVFRQLLAVQQQCRIGQIDEQTQQHVGQFGAVAVVGDGGRWRLFRLLVHQHGQQIGLEHLAAAQIASVFVRFAVTAQDPDEMLAGRIFERMC